MQRIAAKRAYTSLFLALLLFLAATAVSAQGTTAFNFQGQLKFQTKPANESFDFEFTLFDGPDVFLDNFIGRDLVENVEVKNGLFSVILDFGPGIFDGTSLWLQMCVRKVGETSLTCLDPLQQIVPVPYATFSVNSSELDGLDSTSFLRKDTGCKICIGHADNNGSSPTQERCFDLSSNGRSSSNRLQFSGDVDENDRLWLWMECP